MLNRNSIQVILIDPQTTLLNIVQKSSLLISRIILYIKVFRILNIPIIVTRQNPDKLGDIEPLIKNELFCVDKKLTNGLVRQYDKTCFSCFNEDKFTSHLSESRKYLLIMGVETAICVMQSVVQACDKGYKVTVLADAISGRKEEDSNLAINRIINSGASVLGFDSVVYEIIKDSKSLYFKTLLPLIKSYPVE